MPKNTVIIPFCCTILLGLFAIFFHPNVASIGLFLVMIAYAVYIIHNRAGFTLPPDRMSIADSFYYMGFIFTIASLVAYLTAAKGELNSEEFLSVLSAAMITTLIGFALRILYTETYGDSAADSPASVDQRLNAGYKEMGSTLLDISASLSDIKSGFSDLSKDVQTVKKSFSAINKTSATAGEHIEQMASNLAGVGQQFGSELTQSVQNFDRVLNSLSDTLKAQAEGVTEAALKAMAQFSQEQNKAMQETAKSLLNTVKMSKEVVQKFQEDLTDLPPMVVEKINADLDRLSVTIDQFTAQSEKGGLRFNTASQAIHDHSDQLAAALKSVESEMTQFATTTRRAGQEFSGTGQSLTNSLTALNKAAADIDSASKAYEKAFSDMALNLAHSFDSVSDAVSGNQRK